MRNFFLLILALFSVFLITKEHLRRQNIVLITIDSLGAKHMGIYGYAKNTTPFLDSFFKKGAVFENAISTSHLTFPSINSLLTGFYPSQVNSKTDTLPKILEKNGYFVQRIVTQDRKKDFISQLNNKGVNKPQFIFLNIRETEMPYEKPEKEFYSKHYEGPFFDMSLAKWDWNLINKNGVLTRDGKLRQKFTKEDEVYFTAAYDSAIREVDRKLEEFLRELSSPPYSLSLQNTIFIITSGHGNSISEHQFPFHQDLYDTNIHIPLGIIGRGIKPEVINGQVSLIDAMPTILKLLDIPSYVDFEGKNLFEQKKDRLIFSERVQLEEYSVRGNNFKFILRNPQKKLLKFDPKRKYADYLQNTVEADLDTGDELYDLAKDPDEQVNLIDKNLSVEQFLREKTEEFKNRMLKSNN